MADVANPQTVDTVNIANLKTVAEQPAQLANIALSNAVAFQQAMNQNMLATSGAVSQATTALGSRGAANALTGPIIDSIAAENALKAGTGELSERVADLGTAVAAIQEMLRPGKPVTAPIG